MAEITEKLPANVSRLILNDKEIYLIGTAHVSKDSVDDVKNTIEIVKPDSVCVELCAGRYRAMVKKDIWRNMDIFKVIKEKKAVLLLAQLIMSSFYRKLGERLGVQPGAEMLEAINQAQNINAELVLADRPIDITLKRVWGYLGFWSKVKLLSQLLAGIFEKEKIDEELINKLKSQDQLEAVMGEFARAFPEIKKRLIDERDICLAQKIRQSGGKKIVAVVGAGHVAGITENIKEEHSLVELEQLPPKSKWANILKWGIPAIIVLLLAIGLFKEHSVKSIWIWVLVTGTFSALGAAAALAHPWAILTAFVAAPLTTIHPLLAAGWFSGLVQAYIRRPTVADCEQLVELLASMKIFWTNPVIKILLVVALTNLGATIGTLIAFPWIIARLL